MKPKPAIVRQSHVAYSASSQSDLCALQIDASQIDLLAPNVGRVAALDGAESLAQAHCRVASLSQSELLTETDPGATVERKVLPAWAKTLRAARRVVEPTLRFELLSVSTVVVGAAVHGVDTPSYDSAFGDEERRCAVWSATDGESGVFLSFAGVLGYDGVETKGLVEE